MRVGRRVGDGSWSGLLIGMLVGLVVGALVAAITELVFIRPLYNRHIEQVLVTVGLALATVALFDGIWGTDARFITRPRWMGQTTRIAGANVPNDRFVAIVVAAAVPDVLVEDVATTAKTFPDFPGAWAGLFG